MNQDKSQKDVYEGTINFIEYLQQAPLHEFDEQEVKENYNLICNACIKLMYDFIGEADDIPKNKMINRINDIREFIEKYHGF